MLTAQLVEHIEMLRGEGVAKEEIKSLEALTPRERVSVFDHECQHAVEIARNAVEIARRKEQNKYVAAAMGLPVEKLSSEERVEELHIPRDSLYEDTIQYEELAHLLLYAVQHPHISATARHVIVTKAIDFLDPEVVEGWQDGKRVWDEEHPSKNSCQKSRYEELSAIRAAITSWEEEG